LAESCVRSERLWDCHSRKCRDTLPRSTLFRLPGLGSPNMNPVQENHHLRSCWPMDE